MAADTQQLVALIDEVSRLSNTVGDTLALLRRVSEVGAAAVDIAAHNNNGDAHAALFGDRIRNRLTRDTTFYVRPDGSDNNDGLAGTPARALKTIAGALSLLNRTDQRGCLATVSLAPGNWPNTAIHGENISGRLRVTSTDTANKAVLAGFSANSSADVEIGNIAFTGPLRSQNNSFLRVIGAIDFFGSMEFCMDAGAGSVLRFSGATSLVVFNDVTVALATALTSAGSTLLWSGAPLSGNVTGRRFSVGAFSFMHVNGKGPDYIPGTIAGIVDPNGGILI